MIDRFFYESPPTFKFHGNPSGGSCAVTCRETDRWDTTQLGYIFCNYANMIKNKFLQQVFLPLQNLTYHSKFIISNSVLLAA